MLLPDEMSYVDEGVHGSADLPHGALAVEWRIGITQEFSERSLELEVVRGTRQDSHNFFVIVIRAVPASGQNC
jgi:hypothetical protein